ncbi:bifunctional diguanylate cyclase/phosphodiesterase [Rhizobium sp. C4]|uniref:bifunctional diguanylate cyclase/phosphodiesterase n=1 Tax=Rhizobium sp. C4 TaxID=1349800 RepID=UPI001E5B26A1|nr:EAL domain-containing protein [Rhizobium sp. C4]MCD2172968.1 EAL domain-containing protein [Rhizobium sp. C4]
MRSIAKEGHHGGWLAYAQIFVAALSLSVAAYFLDRNYEETHADQLRLKAASTLALKQETLAQRIQFELASVVAIRKSISEMPDIGMDDFAAVAQSVMRDNPDIMYICAKSLTGVALEVGRDGYAPIKPDPRSLPRPRNDYLLSSSRSLEAASLGPVVHMEPAGYALRLSIPVFSNHVDTIVHWGSITAYIDPEKLFLKTGILQPDERYRVALKVAGQTDDALAPFFSEEDVRSVFHRHPVRMSLNVLSDTWNLAAVPVDGWGRSTALTWTSRGVLLAIGIIVLLPFFRSLRLRRLNEQSQAALARREILLQRLTKRLDLALGSYQCGVWEAAIASGEVYWDERMQDLHGVHGRPDWVTRENWQSLIHPDDMKRTVEGMERVASQQGNLSLTVRIIRPDGAVRILQYVAQLNNQGGDKRLYGIALDITEDAALNEELRLAKQESERKNVELERALLQLSANERDLRLVSERLNLAMKAYGCGIWESNLDTQTHYWDARMHELYNFPVTDGKTNRERWLSRVHPEDRERALAGRLEAAARGGHYSATYRIMPTPDTVRHLRVMGIVHTPPGEQRRFIGLAVDATDDIELQRALDAARREAEAKNRELEAALARLSGREADLQELTQRFQLAIEASGYGIWEADIESGIAVWDRRMHEYFEVPYVDGRNDDESFLRRLHPEDRERVEASVHEAIEHGSHYSCGYRIITSDGSIRHLQAMGQTHRAADGKLKFIGIALDVTEPHQKNEALLAAKNDAEAKRAELEAMHAMLQHNATHDPLTGLHNRRALDEALERLADEPQDPQKRVTLLHIDLDRFKQINDTLGHAAGDAMLVHAANVLRKNTRKNDLVARIGGDEFVVLVQNNATNKDIATLAGRIIDRMNIPLDYQGQECRFGVSIGIAREQTRRSSVKQLLVNADIALYRAKAHGRNRFEFFTSNLQAEIRRNKTLADQILRGLENREFVAWYQPQFCAKTHALTGMEALVRWNHPERGLLTPDHFLKNAEEINALATIDSQVLEQAMTDRLAWAAKGFIVPKISVNVSARRLRDDQLVKSLKDLAISPGQIAFELVESIYLDDDDDVITRNIRRLKSLGIDIEIDDFGTGHTSIVSLLKLEPKRLKIDRQLVQPMLTSSREFSLVRSIIDIGTSLDIETVAEGVESMTHAIRLQELGCSVLQGYAFAKPLPAADIVDFVARAPWTKVREMPFLASAI